MTSPAEAAAGLWLSRRIRSLRCDPARLDYPFPVHFDSIEHYCRMTPQTCDEILAGAGTRDGLTIRQKQPGSTALILYREGLSPARRLFTLAHEVGHLMLGHLDDSPEAEAGANEFAGYLLLPPVLLAELGRRGYPPDAAQTSLWFGVSRQTAAIAWQKLMRHSPSHTERELLRQYAPLLPHPEAPTLL